MVTDNNVDERNGWLDYIEGRTNPRTHGYYCTIQPASRQRQSGITYVDARASEMKYFAHTSPWCSADSRRFGTDNLIPVLGKLLVDVISTSYAPFASDVLGHSFILPHSLPRIQSETDDLLKKCKVRLSEIPKSVGDEPITTMTWLIHNFSAKVKEYVDGSPSNPLLVKNNQNIFATLNKSIISTIPDFRPFIDEKEFPKEGRPDGPTPSPTPALNGPPVFLKEVKQRINE